MLHESGEALSWKVGGVRSLITTSAIAKKEHSKLAPEISDLAQLQVLPQERREGIFISYENSDLSLFSRVLALVLAKPTPMASL